MGFSVDVLKQFTTVMLVIWSVSTIVPFINWGANNLLAFLMLYSIVILIKRMGITYENHKSGFKALILIPYSVAAEATFGVYLFHMYPANMTYLFEKLFSLQKVIEKPYAVLWVVAVTAIIFVTGVAIDSLRKAMFSSFEFLTNLIRAKNNSACS